MATVNLGRVVGKSAYEVWLDAGNTGTEADYLESLKGEITTAQMNTAISNALVPVTSQLADYATKQDKLADSVYDMYEYENFTDASEVGVDAGSKTAIISEYVPTDSGLPVTVRVQNDNYFDLSYAGNTTNKLLKGINITYADGAWTLNGTATGDIALEIITVANMMPIKSGTYIMWGAPLGGSTATYYLQWKNGADVTVYSDIGADSISQVVFPADGTLRANIRIASGTVCNNIVFAPIIEKRGTTSTRNYVASAYYDVTLTSEALPLTVDLYDTHTNLIVTNGSITGYSVSSEYDYSKFDFDVIKDSLPIRGPRTYTGIPITNDFVFIQDELWAARNYETYTTIKRYKIVNDEFMLYKTLTTDFGHLNTMDYNEHNDCLIFGNGASDTETVGNFFSIIKNPLALEGSVALETCALNIPVDIGFKVQAVWADENMGGYDAVYLISNYLDVRKAILTKDVDGEFDGGLVIVETHNFTTLGGMNGGQYFKGHLYLGGAANYEIYDIDCSSWTASKILQTFYKNDGTAYSGTVQGIYFDDQFMWLNCNDAGKSGGERLIRRWR